MLGMLQIHRKKKNMVSTNCSLACFECLQWVISLNHLQITLPGGAICSDVQMFWLTIRPNIRLNLEASMVPCKQNLLHYVHLKWWQPTLECFKHWKNEIKHTKNVWWSDEFESEEGCSTARSKLLWKEYEWCCTVSDMTKSFVASIAHWQCNSVCILTLKQPMSLLLLFLLWFCCFEPGNKITAVSEGR